MEDRIVEAGVYSRYCNKIRHFLAEDNEKEASCFTDYGQAKYKNLLVLQEGKEKRTPAKTYTKGSMDGEATKFKADSNSNRFVALL
jgi:hypothetical protein